MSKLPTKRNRGGCYNKSVALSTERKRQKKEPHEHTVVLISDPQRIALDFNNQICWGMQCRSTNNNKRPSSILLLGVQSEIFSQFDLDT